MPEWDQDSSVNLCRIGERREKGVKKPLLATRLSCPWEQPEGEVGGRTRSELDTGRSIVRGVRSEHSCSLGSQYRL